MSEKTLIYDQLTEQKRAVERLHAELAERGLKYYIESYGCQMNTNDSEKIAGMLSEIGYSPAENKDEADLLLYNTCCVREHAEKRVFGNIGALYKKKQENPGFIVGVAGCMMQQPEVAQKLFKRFPFVNFVMGTHSIQEFPLLIEKVLDGERAFSLHETEGYVVEGMPAVRAQGASASVAIMYGCNNFCTYCIVPYVRGRERSRNAEDIIHEIKDLIAQGYTEITLLGQNVNSYGNDGGNISFPQLLRQINDIPGIRRIRFMTSHPKDLSDELIEVMAQTKNVCPHIHLPVQAGSNRILAAMNRRYTAEDYIALVSKLRAKVPDIELTTDVIVGFPGETEKDFSDTLALMKKVKFAAAFTFMYSPRAGTKAASMPDQISEEIKKDRLLRLNEVQAEETRENNSRYIGQTGEVLVEGCDLRNQAMAFGKLPNFKMVYFPGSSDMIGQYVQVKIEETNKNSLIGKLL